jgi:hypothetical protein
MFPDLLQIIVGTIEVWEKARALVWELINERLLKPRGTTVLLLVGRRPRRLTLDDALADLRTAIRWVELTCPRLPRLFPWLVFARFDDGSYLDCPLDSQAAIEYALTTLPAQLAGPELERVVVQPVQEHATRIRAWLRESKERALPESLSDVERKALRALYSLKAFDQESRKTISTIGRQAEGKHWPNEGPYRDAVPCLVEKGLAKTKEGRGGGAWLTPDGRKIAKSINPER